MVFPAIASHDNCRAHLPTGKQFKPQFAQPVILDHSTRGCDRTAEKSSSLFAKAICLFSDREIVKLVQSIPCPMTSSSYPQSCLSQFQGILRQSQSVKNFAWFNRIKRSSNFNMSEARPFPPVLFMNELNPSMPISDQAIHRIKEK